MNASFYLFIFYFSLVNDAVATLVQNIFRYLGLVRGLFGLLDSPGVLTPCGISGACLRLARPSQIIP